MKTYKAHILESDEILEQKSPFLRKQFIESTIMCMEYATSVLFKNITARIYVDGNFYCEYKLTRKLVYNCNGSAVYADLLVSRENESPVLLRQMKVD